MSPHTRAPAEAPLLALALALRTPILSRGCPSRSQGVSTAARLRTPGNKHPNVFLGCISGMKPGRRSLSAFLPRAATFQANPLFPQDKRFPLEGGKGCLPGVSEERMSGAALGAPRGRAAGSRWQQSRAGAALPSRGTSPIPGLPHPRTLPIPRFLEVTSPIPGLPHYRTSPIPGLLHPRTPPIPRFPGVTSRIPGLPSSPDIPDAGVPLSPDIPDPGGPSSPGIPAPRFVLERASITISLQILSFLIFLSGQGISLRTVRCPGSSPSRKGKHAGKSKLDLCCSPSPTTPKLPPRPLQGPAGHGDTANRSLPAPSRGLIPPERINNSHCMDFLTPPEREPQGVGEPPLTSKHSLGKQQGKKHSTRLWEPQTGFQWVFHGTYHLLGAQPEPTAEHGWPRHQPQLSPGTWLQGRAGRGPRTSPFILGVLWGACLQAQVVLLSHRAGLASAQSCTISWMEAWGCAILKEIVGENTVTPGRELGVSSPDCHAPLTPCLENKKKKGIKLKT